MNQHFRVVVAFRDTVPLGCPQVVACTICLATEQILEVEKMQAEYPDALVCSLIPTPTERVSLIDVQEYVAWEAES